jgi:hypothetical protein
MKMYKGVEIQVHALLSWALLEVSDELHTEAISPPGNQPQFSFVWGAERVLVVKRRKGFVSVARKSKPIFPSSRPLFTVRHMFVRTVTSVCWLFSLFEILYQLQCLFSVEYLYVFRW